MGLELVIALVIIFLVAFLFLMVIFHSVKIDNMQKELKEMQIKLNAVTNGR